MRRFGSPSSVSGNWFNARNWVSNFKPLTYKLMFMERLYLNLSSSNRVCIKDLSLLDKKKYLASTYYCPTNACYNSLTICVLIVVIRTILSFAIIIINIFLLTLITTRSQKSWSCGMGSNCGTSLFLESEPSSSWLLNFGNDLY